MKAQIYPYFSRIYKNGNETALPQPEIPIPIGMFDFHIGDFGKIVDLTQYDAIYYSNDTNQEHPVYIMKPEYRANKINLNEETISTFFVNDDDYNDLGDGFAVKNDKVIGYGFDNNNVNYSTYTLTTGYEGEVAPADRYNQVPYDETRYYYKETFSDMIPRAKLVYQEVFENGTVEGIRAVYDSRDDSMMAPAMNMVNRYFEYYDKNGTDIYMRSGFGASGATTNSFQYGGSNRNSGMGYSGNFQVKQEVQDDPEEIKYVEFYPPVPYNATKVNNSSDWLMGYGTRTGTGDSTIKTIPIFLKDANGEYWILFICRLGGYSTYSYGRTYNFTRWAPMVIKVKDIPINMPNNGAIASGVAEWITNAHFTSPSVLDEYLDAVFGDPSAGSDYNDGGPDAYGPGDPYADVGNAGDAIGGNSNLVDDLAVNDKTPNTGMTQYMVSGGLYGAYKLDVVSLQQYANTLNMLYSKSSNILLGAIWEQYANRITKNSNSLIMLPYDINDTALSAPDYFCVGSACISRKITNNDDSWNDYLFGGTEAIAKVPRIINEWSYFETDLGYLDHYYDNFLDFAPYVTASLYLPYIGTVPLPLNLIQSTSEERKHLTLTWNISNLTGDIVCMLNVNDMTIMYWTGNCARTIPMSIDNNGTFMRECTQQIIGSILNVIK